MLWGSTFKKSVECTTNLLFDPGVATQVGTLQGMCLWLRPVDVGDQCKAWGLDLWNGWNPTLWGRRWERSEETSVTGPLGPMWVWLNMSKYKTYFWILLIHVLLGSILVGSHHGRFLAWSHVNAAPPTTKIPPLLGPCAGWVLRSSPLALSWPTWSARKEWTVCLGL